MASILDQYGIKEVADVTFYEINELGEPGAPVLYLNTLKVSNIEGTAETTHATGGKGNARLIAWDYGKEINVTLTDALFSPKSLSIMMGTGAVDIKENGTVRKTVEFRATATDVASGAPTTWKDPNGIEREISSPVIYDANENEIDAVAGELVVGERYFITFDQPIVDVQEIVVSADSFPGTYYVTGDTFARPKGKTADELFQFIIPQAKVASETNLTMEAEGDPSTFDMTLNVLRADDGQMMKLVKYNLPAV